jgi:hypothetical protein
LFGSIGPITKNQLINSILNKIIHIKLLGFNNNKLIIKLINISDISISSNGYNYNLEDSISVTSLNKSTEHISNFPNNNDIIDNSKNNKDEIKNIDEWNII